LKPYGGSRTLNNQFTSSQKPVWILQEELPANRAKSSKKGQQNAQKNKERYKTMPLWEKLPRTHNAWLLRTRKCWGSL